MVTPKQVLEAGLAIKAQGLRNEDFEHLIDASQIRLWYMPAGFEFKFTYRGDHPPSILHGMPFTTPLYVMYTPKFENGTLTTNMAHYQANDWEEAMGRFNRWLAWIKSEYGPFDTLGPNLSLGTITEPENTPALAHLHPAIQQAASSLYATGHYRQALLDAFIAVDNAVQAKSQLTGSGTRLMEVAFSPGNPVLKIGDSPDEQQGFMALFRGAMLAIRNPKAHSLNGTHDAQRALEWLSFASVLLRNLDEAELVQPPTAPVP